MGGLRCSLPLRWNCSLLYRPRGVIRFFFSQRRRRQPAPATQAAASTSCEITQVSYPGGSMEHMTIPIYLADGLRPMIYAHSRQELCPYSRDCMIVSSCRHPTRNSAQDAASTWVRRVCGIFAIGSHRRCMLSAFIDWARMDRRGRR